MECEMKHKVSLQQCYITDNANEGPVEIQYKCLFPVYVFPEMKLRDLIISKTEL